MGDGIGAHTQEGQGVGEEGQQGLKQLEEAGDQQGPQRFGLPILFPLRQRGQGLPEQDKHQGQHQHRQDVPHPEQAEPGEQGHHSGNDEA